MEELLSWKAVAHAANVPEATARRWREQWPAYFVAHDRGRYAKYEPEAVDVLRAIKPLADAQLTPEEIDAALAAEFTPVLDASPPEVVASPPLAALGEAIRASLMEDLHAIADAVTIASAHQQAEIERLKRAVEASAAREEAILDLLRESEEPRRKSAGIKGRVRALLQR